YGPRDRQWLPLVRLAARGRFLLAAPPAMAFTLVHVDDVARAIVMAAEDPRALGEALFIGHPAFHTAEAILRQIAAAVGRPFRPWRVPGWAVKALALAGEVAWRFSFTPIVDHSRLAELSAPGFVCSVERAQQVLGFRAQTEFEEGMTQTVRWYREHGCL